MKYYLARAANKFRFLKKINLTVPRTINGTKVQIPLVHGIGFENLYISEFWMCELLKKIIPLKKGSFIDVGVNLGQTLIKLRTVDGAMDYIGFEPNPACVYYSNELISANGYSNCRLLPVGLYDNDTVLQLNLYSEGNTDSAASLVDDFRPDSKVHRKIYVPVNRFEKVGQLLNIDQIAIIKIDVEGAELEVLQSLLPVIDHHRPMLIMEILPCYTSDNTVRIGRQQKLEALLRERDYCIVRIIKKDNGRLIERLQVLDEIGVHDNLEWCEYLLLPKVLVNPIVTGFQS